MFRSRNEMSMAEPTTRPDGYQKRIVDPEIERYLNLFGAVEISGTRWCGKTWSSLAHGSSVTYVDRGANLMLVQADPSFALSGEKPHVIDEWQLVPPVWDVVRHAVDDSGGAKGLWILTGSSTPASDETQHSGAGRIGRIHMHPMALAESGESSASVSIAGLFEGRFAPCSANPDIEELAHLCVRGGWPALQGFGSSDAQEVVHSYLSDIFAQSVSRMGGDPVIAERTAESVARNLAQAATLSTLARDVYAIDDNREPTNDEEQTVSRHLNLLARAFLLDRINGWVPPSRSPKRMRTKPKNYFADPSLAVALLGMSADSLMQDWQTFGLVFENLCMRDLAVYACALPQAGAYPLHYYRDDSGLEADAVIERADGSWAAFEIKLSPEKADEAATSLMRLKRKLLKNSKARTREPSFLAVVTGTGEVAYRRPDGVFVIPIRTLGA